KNGELSDFFRNICITSRLIMGLTTSVMIDKKTQARHRITSSSSFLASKNKEVNFFVILFKLTCCFLDLEFFCPTVVIFLILIFEDIGGAVASSKKEKRMYHFVLQKKLKYFILFFGYVISTVFYYKKKYSCVDNGLRNKNKDTCKILITMDAF
ncbi:hypothetical protein RFI_26738, partial [Reticulomyxa filosa]